MKSIRNQNNKKSTNPDKILFPKDRIKKIEIIKYYQEIEQWILPHIRNRPLSLVRCPGGTAKKCFYQKHLHESAAKSLKKVWIQEKEEKDEYLYVEDLDGILELVQKDAIELHAWNCKWNSLNFPDQIVMDLDPGPSVQWSQIIDAAWEIKEKFDQMKLKSFVNLTGSKGIHIHVPIEPIYTWDQVRAFTQAISKEMALKKPHQYVASMSKKLRDKKIFIDYLRNGFGATAIVPYSLRAKEKSSVALPVAWEELSTIKSSSQFSLKKTLTVLALRKDDPWRDYSKVKQKISFLNSAKK